ncbi:MAG: BlaI/MecI/CopY family transcriptional regulator [Bacteroidia bacterium]|nr:BlaI/MecI/CopY family transcriptional regulator [Bacteroidia bacterium]
MSQTQKPTEAELEILKVLWQSGPSTVRFVHEELAKHREVGYTTTLKQMQIMHDRKMLSRKKMGKTHIYTAQVSEKETQKQMLDKLVDTAFQGSAMKLVMQALGNGKTSSEELKEIRKFLDQLENDQ